MLLGLKAHPDFKEDLLKEVSHRDAELVYKSEEFLIVQSQFKNWVFAQNIWLKPERLEFKSISEAQKLLRERGKFWNLTKTVSVRRAQLIQEGLPKFKIRSLLPFTPMPTIPLGSWCLESENVLWCSAKCSSPYPDGKIPFEENKTEPPSRAYLKLWEALTIQSDRPQAGELCVDLGSVPGGWTWVLAGGLRAEVISVDKADLDPRVLKMPGVRWLKKDAFALDPKSIGKVKWLFSDIICYPPRLLELVQQWIAETPIEFAICTIKFQGETDFKTMDGFAAIHGSRVLHLWHNKHEVTWFYRR